MHFNNYLWGALLLSTILLTNTSTASEAEVEYLLSAVGNSGCLFIRNGAEHPPAEAEGHLRMKYKNGSRYVSSTDDFITRIASKSSWSGNPYQILCPGKEPQSSSQWLNNQLSHFRSQTKLPD
ncbi:MAG: DUF5329 domain-containing protein [Gammaproteobacteria bacterium]|nr:DUF5329 domain-containing protein [Gammaproteobacteria bacterium]MCP4091691.1 DUF5329 domain-containing protein [Gammaproteobacteria bacterium]MCP4274998.1 DUF5329 domain-containing protein [Gammaproteobacteria bacterium]MCP4831821.1 DUF5329 domain-containing protein [Gammaproteobacteria bacterium]MCP4929757.1 DUF5329 domain-containing protein [Gammaproteobacteria bacterium]